jgi:hypothetical protein
MVCQDRDGCFDGERFGALGKPLKAGRAVRSSHGKRGIALPQPPRESYVFRAWTARHAIAASLALVRTQKAGHVGCGYCS